MYQPMELARFAISEFERGLEGLTDTEARMRVEKAGGAEMNAISWTIGHIAGHWLWRPNHLDRYNFRSDDPTPPPQSEALKLLDEAKTFTDNWLTRADDAVLSLAPPRDPDGESVGTGVMRAALHTWFHAGEINAIRQMLGYPEIGFVGDVRGRLEWRGAPDGAETGYRPDELARFAISEFERGLVGLTDEEARFRAKKADGTEMNAISWTIGHIATHWHFMNTLITEQRMPSGGRAFFGRGADPTPPSLADIRELLTDTKERTEAWLPGVEDELLLSTRDFGPQADENLGTQLMRATLHTWFHTGEINAARQMLGHVEISFVGKMLGSLEWRGAPR